MSKFVNLMLQFVREEDAPTAVEYAVMVALIAAVVGVGAAQLGTDTNNLFTAVAGTISGT